MENEEGHRGKKH